MPISNKIPLYGKLLVKDSSGKLVPYGVPETSVTLNFVKNDNGTVEKLALGAYDSAGNFKIEVPYVQNSFYIGTIQVTDTKG